VTKLDLKRGRHRATPARRWSVRSGLVVVAVLAGPLNARAQDVEQTSEAPSATTSSAAMSLMWMPFVRVTRCNNVV